jgi:hypothetical protein
VDAYCTIADIFSFAPEMRTEQDAGTVADTTRIIYVKQATIDVKNALQGQYNLTQVEAQLTLNNLDVIRDMAAMRAAWIILSTYQLGKNGDTRMAYLEKRFIQYKRLIAKGSVRCNDGTYLSAINVVDTVVSPIPRELEEVYRDGDRLGLPRFEFSSPGLN